MRKLDFEFVESIIEAADEVQQFQIDKKLTNSSNKNSATVKKMVLDCRSL